MKNILIDLNRKLNALSVFRSILETPVVSGLQKLLYAIGNSPLDEQLRCYGAFSNALYAQGGNLSLYIENFVLTDENVYIKHLISNKLPNKNMYRCLNEELQLLQEVAELTSPQIVNAIDYNDYLPHWDTQNTNLKEKYDNMLNSIATKGYGIFAEYKAFRVNDGKLVPVKNFDCQPLTSLYGYNLERQQVLDNTKALASGKPASNVLLYGDAGTGKSSTVKACANELSCEGVRLIEFEKNQLQDIPVIAGQLYNSPLKFIFFIDDLSFGQNDDSFCYLKGLLEGNISGRSDNTVIYATSNRRHLIKESLDERIGNDLHLNDTLQETMSLSSRFGLTITFSKPEKDLYLEIVENLAEEFGITAEKEELFRKAEAFAIRSNGRSPRTAKQFIILVNEGIK